VGNIFSFGSSKSQQLGLYFTDESGHEQPVVLGSYGVGVTRLMGVIVEHFADDKGMVWPESITPFKIYLARLGIDEKIVQQADDVYNKLTQAGIAVLYDDRDVRAGEMFADADLMGLPYRLVVSGKTAESAAYELKRRTQNETRNLSIEQLIEALAS
jgi:prolyl-tRNA synthetase